MTGKLLVGEQIEIILFIVIILRFYVLFFKFSVSDH